jgi:hypothetical protein
VDLRGNWVGNLPAMPVLTGGTQPATSLKLSVAADALLYIAPRDLLTGVIATRSELEGTAYRKEVDRLTIMKIGMALAYDNAERPFWARPGAKSADPPGPSLDSLPPPPKSMNDPLPPRPPSR